MLTKLIVCFLIILLRSLSPTSDFSETVADSNEIAFVSDTQAPMCIEKLYLRSNHNTLATKLLFTEITNYKPRCLFILGDVVTKGRQEKRWLKIDQYIAAARNNGIPVYALLGNHDVIGNAKKGEAKFNNRFPDQVNTGFLKIVDSLAIILLNSNFKTLSSEQKNKQQDFYAKTLEALDEDPGVKYIIVSCHHAPYSNSKIVGSNKTVQQQFVPLFDKSKKAKLFITGHAHDFECFQFKGKYFLTIGGGGGLHHPLNKGGNCLPNQATGYEPQFHYLLVRRQANQLNITSQKLKDDFSGFETGYSFVVH
ncbi:MAG: metallophosphoesterase family protein [Ferruginibacter sp.]